MSRTEKTQPWEWKVLEHPIEHHDHRNGVCELLVDPTKTTQTRGECHLTGQFWRPEFGCGRSCPVCGRWWSKSDARRSRQSGKRQAWDWRKEYE